MHARIHLCGAVELRQAHIRIERRSHRVALPYIEGTQNALSVPRLHQMPSAGLSIPNQLAAEIFRQLTFICANESAKEILLEFRHDIGRFTAKQAVIDMSRHVNVFRVFAACGSTHTDSSNPIVSKPSDLKYASMVLCKALGEEGLP